MRVNFDYTIIRLISENLLNVVAFIALNAILLFGAFFYVGQYQKNSLKIKSLESEIAEYNRKRELLEFKNLVVKDEVDLDYINQILSRLIPTKEDYFSIISALEKLSSETNFIITSYNIVVGSSGPEKLAIEIEGQGDPEAFLNFLREYKFSGGRLITIDKINFTQEAFTGAKVSINVYTGAANVAQPKIPSEVNTQLIEEILQKVQLELKSEDVEMNEYPTKSNPF